MKKQILILLILALSVSAFLGCASTKAQNDSVPAVNGSEENNSYKSRSQKDNSEENNSNEEKNTMVGTWYYEATENGNDYVIAYQFLSNGTAYVTRLKKMDGDSYKMWHPTQEDYWTHPCEFSWYAENGLYIGWHIFPTRYRKSLSSSKYEIIGDKLTLTCYEWISTANTKYSQELTSYDGSILGLIEKYIDVETDTNYSNYGYPTAGEYELQSSFSHSLLASVFFFSRSITRTIAAAYFNKERR